MSADQGAEDFGPLDERDAELLARLRECAETLDPMPPQLVDRTLFALALQELDAWPAGAAGRPGWLQPLEPAGARGGDSALITFEADGLTVMIRISVQGRTARIDGWLAPPGPTRVELRTGEGALSAPADADGRFVLEQAPRGPAQLVVHAGATAAPDGGETVLTPAIVL